MAKADRYPRVDMSERNNALDFSRLLLAFFVVGIHTSFAEDVSVKLGFLFGNGLFRIAVPIFFIINGFYFRSTVERKQVKAWFLRVLKLYLSWMVIYSWFWIKPDPSAQSLVEQVFSLADTVVFGYFHLWYVPAMLLAAALIYSFRNWNDRILIFTSALAFLFGIILQFLGYFDIVGHPVVNWVLNKPSAHRNFLFLGFPFLSIGYLFRKWKLQRRFGVRQIMTAVVLGLLALFAETLAYYAFTTEDKGLDNFLSLILVSPAIFLMTFKIPVSRDGRFVSALASGVYYSHILCLFLLEQWIGGTSLLTLATFALSLGVSVPLVLFKKRIGFLL